MKLSFVMKKIVNVTIPGTLNTKFSSEEVLKIKDLTVTGTIDARDVKYIRDFLTVLAILDLSEVNIEAYTGNEGPNNTALISYPANEIPEYSFYPGKIALRIVKISNSVNTIGNGAFYGCSGITGNLRIPNSVTTIGN